MRTITQHITVHFNIYQQDEEGEEKENADRYVYHCAYTHRKTMTKK